MKTRRNTLVKGTLSLLIAAFFLTAPLHATGHSEERDTLGQHTTATLADDYLDQEQAQRDGSLSCLYESEIAQGFTPTYDMLTRVALLMRRDSTVIEGLKITLREDYDGGDLATVDMDELIAPGTWAWVEFDFDDIHVTPGETYYLVWDGWHGATPFQNYHWAYGENDPYLRGTNYFYSDTDDTWYDLVDINPDYEDIDFCFKTYGYKNRPPDTPAQPIGASHLIPGVPYPYSTSTVDPERNRVQYLFDWGDSSTSTWTSLYPSNQQVTISHVFHPAGYHDIRVKARDEYGLESSDWSLPYTVLVEDGPPEAPDATGPTSGDAGTPYTYRFAAVDPNMDQVTFRIRWGDGLEDVTGSYDSGETAEITHTWSAQGSYTIEVRAENTLESPWSTLDVSMPKVVQWKMGPLLSALIEWFTLISGKDLLPAMTLHV